MENFGGVCLCGTRAGANTPLLGGFKWLPWGPPFVIRKVGRWKHSIGIQALQGLTTIAKQLGEIAASDLKLSHSPPDSS